MTKVICIIQVRMWSTRLPGKVLKEIDGKPMLQYLLDRVTKSTLIDKLVVATSDESTDDVIVQFCEKYGVESFRWSHNNLLERYYRCLQEYEGYDYVVRITGDCPLADPKVIDATIQKFMDSPDAAYGCNVLPATFPDGLDVEVTKPSYFFEARENATLESEFQSPFIYIITHHEAKKINYACYTDYSKYRLTVDEPEDFALIDILFRKVGAMQEFEEYILYMQEHNLFEMNSKFGRNDGTKELFKNDDLGWVFHGEEKE